MVFNSLPSSIHSLERWDHWCVHHHPSHFAPAFNFVTFHMATEKVDHCFGSHFLSLPTVYFISLGENFGLRGRCQGSCNRTAVIRRRVVTCTSRVRGMLREEVRRCVGLTQVAATLAGGGEGGDERQRYISRDLNN